MAQRYPELFDGIASGAPSLFYPDLLMWLLWSGRALTPVEGQPPLLPPASRQLLARAALAACDKDDGLADDQITNPPTCRFDPAVLSCQGDPGPDCLTAQQIAHGVGRDHLDGDAGFLLAQLPHQRRQQLGGHGIGGRDRHHAAHRLRSPAGGQAQGLGGHAHGACVLQQIQPRGRERHGLAHALEQGHPHALLDGGHLAAQRGLGQAQFAGGGRERAGFRRFQKRL